MNNVSTQFRSFAHVRTWVWVKHLTHAWCADSYIYMYIYGQFYSVHTLVVQLCTLQKCIHFTAYLQWQNLSHPAGQILAGDPLSLRQTLPPPPSLLPLPSLPSLPLRPPPLSLPHSLCHQMMFCCNAHSRWVRFCHTGARVAWHRLAWLLRGAVYDIAARSHGRGQEWWPTHVGVHVDVASTYTHM